ncbi:MAG: hypothetical protein JXR13_07110 [Thalassovita sp.]
MPVQPLYRVRMLGLEHGEVTFAQSEMSEVLVREAGDLTAQHRLHALLQCRNGGLDQRLGAVWQRDFGKLLLFFLACHVLFPDIANPREFALVAKRLEQISCRDLPAKLRRQGGAFCDDIFVGMNRCAHRCNSLFCDCRRDVGSMAKPEKQTSKIFCAPEEKGEKSVSW